MMAKTEKYQRSDQSIAIYGILGLTGIALVGLIILLGMGREVPEGLLTGVVLGGMTGVLGWARGGTYYDPSQEKVPSPPTEPSTIDTSAFVAPMPVVSLQGDPHAIKAPGMSTAYRLPTDPKDVLE